ncbi:hypothetical protein [Streptomyces sp. NPDC059788]|uniref:hypothetical protein n=1 Tax=Streptomyces sp. NPDC059788 TaxID=3346948 RepID=UPI003663474A
MRSAVRGVGIPRYLSKAFVRATPERMSKGTGALLQGHLRLLVHAARSDGPPLDTADSFAELRSRWAAEGGNAADLLKLVKMVDYRAHALHAPADVEPDGDNGPDALARFWAAGGHDIEELSGFLADVDDEGADWLPG